MKKTANFLVEKRLWLFIGSVATVIACIVLMNFVTINKDMTKYLPKDSSMRAGFDIMNSEFPAATQAEGFKLMFEDLTDEQKDTIKSKLEAYDGVASVDYDADNADYNSGNYTLFVVNTSYTSTEEATTLLNTITEELKGDYTLYSYYANMDDSVLDLLLPIALTLFLLVLVLLSQSYIEVVLLLVSIAFSIAINMGTNIIFSSISDMTLSIAAVLQLVLSIDYSVMMFHRYAQERALLDGKDNVQAMKNAIKNVFSSVSSSALTTIVGLLVLLFMSFTIGTDMGLVMAKGILCSLICVFTVMPTLILWCDGLLIKTNKQYLRRKETPRRRRRKMLDKALCKVGNFSYRFRYLVLTVAVLLFVGVSILQAFAGVSYSYSDYNKVTEIFPEDDTLVIVYDNKDEGKIKALAQELSKNEHVTSINAYATTLGLEMNTAELAATAGIDESFIKTLFYIKANGTQAAGLTFPVFLNFVASDALLSNEMFADKIDDATTEQLLQTKDMVNSIATGTAYDAGTLAAMFGMDAQTVGGIFYMAGTQTMTLEGFVDTMLGMAAQNPNTAAQEQLAQLQQMKGLCTLVKSNEPLSPAELVAVFPVQSEMFNEGTVSLLYLMFYANTADMSGETLALYDFFGFIANDILTNDMFAPYFDEATKAKMTEAKATMDDGKAQLVGEKHSRMILTLDYEFESKEMYDFYSDLEAKLDDSFDGEYHLVGNSAMSNELSKTFKNEHLMISIITAVAIFLVVLLTFRKFSIPLILICIIECAVFITMSAMTIANVSMYFIALIIVQCVLMGSMVDYGILLTNYYVEVREEKSKEEALPEVLKRSVRAISISAIILITITFVCGLLMNGAVASILLTLCIGSLSALLLVIFVLPSLLAVFDSAIVKMKREY